MDSTQTEPLSSSLSLALSGFAVTTASQHSAQLPQRRGARHGRLGTVTCASVAPLVQHARQLATQIVSATSSEEGFSQRVEQLESLCFGLQSTLGLNGRLPEQEEEQIWEISTQLWETSLTRPDSQAHVLASLAKELFELIENECERSEECAAFVSFFAKMARSWAKLEQHEQARWCIERAMRYSEQLEAMLHGDEVPLDFQERCVVQLFNLYIEAAKNATETKQQALANNLMSRAVQLSRHDAVSPDSAVSMCIAITQLQLQQAQALGEGETMLVVALLTAAYQQLAAAAELPSVDNAQLREGVAQLMQEVLLQLCNAHLRAGDAKLALKCLENAGFNGGTAASLPLDAQLMVMRIKLEAGRQAEALQFLLSLLAGINVDCDDDAMRPGFDTWLACLRLALPALVQETLPVFQSVVSSFVWKALSKPEWLLKLLQTLLAVDQGNARQHCQRMALDTLAREDVAISVHKEDGVLKQCHAMLWHKASQFFTSSDVPEARELFSAAFQYARPACRAKNARMLSACHTRLGQHERAVDYLDIAARHEEQPSMMTQLMHLEAYVNTRSYAEALQVLGSLPSCHDFHPSCVPTALAAAAGVADPVVAKEAAAMAVNTLITPDSPSSLPAGMEASLLLDYVSAVRRCIHSLPVAASGPEAAALFKELAAIIRLATKRIKVATAKQLAGRESQAAALEALSSHALNGGLDAYQAKAHEPCVMLLSSCCVLLKELDGVQHSRGSVRQQARALMVATQALLELHASHATMGRANKLLLAQKLLAKVQELVPALPVEQHAIVHQASLLLAVMVASRLPGEASVVQALEDLRQHPTPLPASRCMAILEELYSRKGQSARLCGTLLSLAMRSLQQAGSVAEGLGLAAAAVRAIPASGSQLQDLLKACCQKLRVCRSAAASTAADSASSPWEPAALQWIVAQTWNRGVKLGEEGQADDATALLHLAVALLRASGLAAEVAQAKQLEGELVRWRPQAASTGTGLGTNSVGRNERSFGEPAGCEVACQGSPPKQYPVLTLQLGGQDPMVEKSSPRPLLTAAAASPGGAGRLKSMQLLTAAGHNSPASPPLDVPSQHQDSLADLLMPPAMAAGQSQAAALELVTAPHAALLCIPAGSNGCREGGPATSGAHSAPLHSLPSNAATAAAPSPNPYGGRVGASSANPGVQIDASQHGFAAPGLRVSMTESQSSEEQGPGGEDQRISWLDAITAARKRCDDQQQQAGRAAACPMNETEPSFFEGGISSQIGAADATGPLPTQGHAGQSLQPGMGGGSLATCCMRELEAISTSGGKQGRGPAGPGLVLGTDGADELSLDDGDFLMNLD